MMHINKFLMVSIILWVAAISGAAASFDSVLDQIKAETDRELAENRKREQRFLDAKNDQATLLAKAQAEAQALEQESENLKNTIDHNEQTISDLEEKLHRKMGDLGELFGVIRQVSGELGADLEQSMTSVHYPKRDTYLKGLAERKELPDISALEKLKMIMHEELDATGNIVRFTAPVVQVDGTVKNQEIVRIGAYGAVSQGDFLTYSVEGKGFAKALKQPARRYHRTAQNVENSEKEFVKIMIDPTRGQLLGMLTQKPNLTERIRQGGVIGYIIIGLGICGMLLGGFRFGYLTLVMRRIDRQTHNIGQLSSDNPLGRIGLVYESAQNKTREEKEIVWEEAILKEVPKVEKFNTLIKLLAAVSPLLGLLGTVTGMIITFQSITLFGTSDPKLMAGGISTALITTVLGLSVAIPLLFVYTFVAAKSKTIIDVVEQQSIGLIAKECV